MLALRSAILRLLDWQFLQSASLLGILEIGTWLVGFFSAEPGHFWIFLVRPCASCASLRNVGRAYAECAATKTMLC